MYYLEKLRDVKRAVFYEGSEITKVKIKFINSLPLKSLYSELRDLKYYRSNYLFQH